mgnify:CR=1 FL=1
MTLLKFVRSSALAAFLTFLLAVGPGSEAKAQSSALSVTNATSCPIFVQGHTAIGLTPGCLTAWYMVPAGSTITINPCAGSSYHWYHVYYGNCPQPGVNCAQGTTNSPVASCGLPEVPIPDCTSSSMYQTKWTSASAVTFY